MRFAVVDEQRREAVPGLSAKCPVCGQAMVAKCGEHRVWHWAHRGARNCDTWWESETEWHRNWKDNFPKDWQEIVQWSKDGEKHIADVKTESGVVIEFQHSYLRREERESRENFYRNMVWVVDGLRRLRDRPRFFGALGESRFERHEQLTFLIRDTFNECALLRDWAASQAPVFFDFGDTNEPSDLRHLRFDTPVLWLLYPESSEEVAYLSPVVKAKLLDVWLKGLPLNFHYAPVVKRPIRQSAPVTGLRQTRQSRRPMSFQQYLALRQGARRRFRF